MQEAHILKELRRVFLTHKYALDNAYIFSDTWESDYFSLTDSGYAYEVEVKVTKSDFKRDFAKAEKHRVLSHKGDLYLKRGRESNYYQESGSFSYSQARNSSLSFVKTAELLRPNIFYFACPEGLISPSEVPVYAGLIYCPEPSADKYLDAPRIVKRAPYLDKHKRNLDRILLDKFYHRFLNLKQ